MRHTSTGDVQMHVLLNVPDRGLDAAASPEADEDGLVVVSDTESLVKVDSGIKDRRAFLLQPEIMSGITGSVMATFYDLYENGLEDILVVKEGAERGEYNVAAYTNVTQDSDAYFVKVIVLSGMDLLLIHLPLQCLIEHNLI